MAKRVVKKKSYPKLTIERPPLARTFDVPTPEELLKVFQGDWVKLIFTSGHDSERMWVNVTQAGNMDHWVGLLDNDPVTEGIAMQISHGDEVHFHPYDVVAIELHKRVDQLDDDKPAQEVTNKPVNKINRPWYKNPNVWAVIIAAIITAVATVTAAIITTKKS
jgi:hypothetical protein